MKKVTLIAAMLVVTAGLSLAAPISDGSLLYDDFPGTTLDTVKWPASGGVPIAPTVAGGEATMSTMPSGSSPYTSYLRSKTLDFSGTPDTWVAETRFIYRSIDTPKTYRQGVIMMASSGATGTWQGIAFDLRIRQTYGTTYLVWHGYDNTDLSRTGSGFGVTLNPDQYYKLAVEVRNTDSEVDIYLDDVLVATEALLVGTGENAGQIYPERIEAGSLSGDVGIDMSVDYVSVGVPEPATVALLGFAGIYGLIRKRK